MQSAIVSAPAHHVLRFRIYVLAAFLALAIALAGFWRTYFGPLLAGSLQSSSIIHVHAAVFIGWLLLVIAQASLAATGRKSLHIRVGNVGMVYGVFVLLVGLTTALALFAMRIDAGRIQEAQDKLFAPLTDMLVFAPFLAAAWIYRRRPEVHKRLIIVATTILLIAAVHRMTFLGARPIPPARLLLVWLAPIYLGMIYDFVKQRLIHPVYLLGIVAVVYLKFFRVSVFKSRAWDDFASWLTSLYL
jgi:hypothetical protein